MYGTLFGGKQWNNELTEWLVSEEFEQSKTEPALFVKHFPNGNYVKLLQFVDDLIIYSSNDKTEKEFEQLIKGKYKIQFNGDVEWFLQMRIHWYHDFSYSIDQNRYCKNLLSRFLTPDSKWGSGAALLSRRLQHLWIMSTPRKIAPSQMRTARPLRTSIQVCTSGPHFVLFYIWPTTPGQTSYIYSQIAGE